MRNSKQKTFAVMLASFVALLVAPAYSGAKTLVTGSTVGQFNVNSAGQAEYSIPLAVPPGRAGMTPQLALSYSSSGGDGLLGHGWSISGLSMISRCAATVAQDGFRGAINFDANDRFCFDGQRLKAVAGADGASGTEYRTEVESFTRVKSYGSAGNGPAYFSAETKSGLTMYFGTDPSGSATQGRIEATGRADVMLWAVSRIEDKLGNAIRFVYFEDSSTGEYYPQRIEYTGNGSTGFDRSVVFSYETLSANQRAERYVAGSKISRLSRLSAIKTYVGATLVREYTPQYNTYSSFVDGKLRLTSFQECGPTQCYEPVTFGWQGTQLADLNDAPKVETTFDYSSYIKWLTGDVNGDGVDDVILQRRDNNHIDVVLRFADRSPMAPQPLYSGTTMYFDIADFDGDGVADLLRAFGSNIYIIRFGWNGTTPQAYSIGGASLQIGDRYTWRIGDVDGDGFPDIVRGDDETKATVWRNSGDGTSFNLWSTVPINLTENRPLAPGSSETTPVQWALADIDGDGRAEMVRLNLTDSSGFSTPNLVYIDVTRFGANGQASTYVLADLTWEVVGNNEYINSEPGLRIGDFNGDGLGDVAFQNRGDFKFFISNGRGGIARTWGFGVSLTDQNSVPGWQVADLNQDGVSDVLRRDGGALRAWLFSGYSATGTAPVTALSWAINVPYGVTWTPNDYNGDGLLDISTVVNNNFTTYSLANAKPILVDTFSSAYGNSTVVRYRPLTDPAVYTAPPVTGGRPVVADNFTLTGPMYVVASYDVPDGIGGTHTMTRAYEDGLINRKGRGFLGFGLVSETNSANGVTTASTFSFQTQAGDYWLNGLVTNVQRKLNGRLLSSVDTDWESPATDKGRPNPVATLITERTYNVDATSASALLSTVVTSTLAANVDSYGNVKRVKVTSTDKTKTADNVYTKETVNVYDPTNVADWILGRLVKVTVTDTVPDFTTAATGDKLTATRISSFTYFDASSPFQGMLKSERVEPGKGGNLEIATAYDYDSYGNRTTATTTAADIGGARITTTTYTDDGYFPKTTKNALGHTETSIVDARFGVVTSTTGPNDITTYWRYDEMGRKFREDRADGTSTNWFYANGGVFGNERFNVTVQSSGAPPTTTYYDMLGRPVHTDTSDFLGVTVRKLTRYDSLGRVYAVTEPYRPSDLTITGSTSYSPKNVWTCSVYDAYGRLIQESLPERDICFPGTKKTTARAIAYSGFDTTVTVNNDNGTNLSTQVVTTSVDVRGQTVEVVDALGNWNTYIYSANGDLIQTEFHDKTGDAAKTVTVSMDYDIRGRKIAMTDPDMGTWSYDYNAAGELVKQTDATNNVIDMTYDKLGRLRTRSSTSEGTTTWTYDTATKGVGKLARINNPNTGYVRVMTYDGFGRPTSVTSTIDGANYTTSNTYDTLGRVDTITYPDTGTSAGRFSVRNVYNAYGFLTRVENAATANVFWKMDEQDAFGRITNESLAGGKYKIDRNYDNADGSNPWRRLMYAKATVGGSATAIQNLNFTWDWVGNLTERVDTRDTANVLSETFTYDALNRLKTTKLSVKGSTPLQTGSYTYDNNGNIKSKSTFGTTYVYDPVKVHAVKTVKDAAGTVIASYGYDAAGRMLNQNGTDIVYTSFGQPQTLTKAGKVTSFKYNADLMRVVQDNNERVLTYLDPSPANGGHLYEKEYVRATFTTIHRHFIHAPTGRVAEYEVKVQGTTVTPSASYFLTDHLGSIDAVLDAAGAVTERLSFDAFGARRNTADWSEPSDTSPIKAKSTLLGYTGHEQLDQVGLVHMNGRLYDPALGRFTSADPHVDGAGNTQGYNRYSYVQNNPMNATDPSGYFNLRQEFRNFTKNSLKATGLYQANQYIKGHEWAQQALQIGVMFVPGAGVAGQLLVSAYLTAANGGNVADVMSSVISTGWSLAMTAGVGGLKETESVLASRNVVKMLAHGVVGGTTARIGGGNFNDGFKSAAVTQFFSPAISGIPGNDATARATRIVAAAIVGGTAAELGGGKFGNGAVTGAFSRAYNHELHHEYEYETEICSRSGSACTPENVWNGVKDNSVPFQEGRLVDGAINEIPGIGTVRTRVDDANYTLTNKTLDDHLFRDGTVTRSLVVTEDTISVRTTGVGTNINRAVWGANYAASPYFKGLDYNIKASIAVQQTANDISDFFK